MARPYSVPHDLKWFQLGTIVCTSFCLPSILIGAQIARQFGAGIAISSILVANLMLWLIAMAVISMASDDRSNSIENVKVYLGKYGALFMWLTLMASILNWFVLQINEVIPSIGAYFGHMDNRTLVRLGAALGFFTTLLSVGGIRLIKWVTLISFPFVFLYYMYTIFHSDFSLYTKPFTWGLSTPAIVSATLILIPGAINLPTLFRFSRSKSDSYVGLAIMFILISLFECSSIWMKFTENWTLIYEGVFYSFLTLIFITLTLIYINLINIFFASACWETYVPRFEGPKGYVVTGLLGTAAYTFIQVSDPLLYIGHLSNAYLANLGAIILIAFLVQIIIRHRPRKFEKIINNICWAIGCIASTLLVIQNPENDASPILFGMGYSALAYLVIIFIEETTWATKKLLKNEYTPS